MGDGVLEFLSKNLCSLFVEIVAVEKLIDRVDAADQICMLATYQKGRSEGWNRN